MSTEYPSSWDCCATCAFWIGHREIDYFCQYVKVDSPTATGKCKCRDSWWNCDRQVRQSCSFFKKWQILEQ